LKVEKLSVGPRPRTESSLALPLNLSAETPTMRSSVSPTELSGLAPMSSLTRPSSTTSAVRLVWIEVRCVARAPVTRISSPISALASGLASSPASLCAWGRS
jgi:hypothetical protein